MRATLMTLLVLASAPAFARADEKPNDDVKARIATYVESGTGVYYETANHDVKDGEFVRLFIVGQSVIPTSLGVEEGLEVAQERRGGRQGPLCHVAEGQCDRSEIGQQSDDNHQGGRGRWQGG